MIIYFNRFPGVQKPIDQYGSSTDAAVGGAKVDDDDDDFDPFASDDEVSTVSHDTKQMSCD